MRHIKINKKGWERIVRRKPVRFETPSSSAVIYRSELDFIFRCILDYKNIETGGELFGFWSVTGTPVVLYAIGPGPHANHQPTFFNQDIGYLHAVGGELVRRFGLHHIGEWHSHHQLGLARPSGHDARTMTDNIQAGNLHRFLCCIGNCREERATLNAFNFTDAGRYVQAEWVVKDMASPFRQTIDDSLGKRIIQPRTQLSIE